MLYQLSYSSMTPAEDDGAKTYEMSLLLNPFLILERITGIEPVAFSLATRCSSSELHPHSGAPWWDRTTDPYRVEVVLYR